MLILKIAVTLAFLFAGGAKLAGAKPLIEQFDEFGLPLWLMRAIGILEVAGAIGLWINALAFWAALGLGLLMIGAVGNHIKAGHPFARSAPAAMLLLLCVLVLTL